MELNAYDDEYVPHEFGLSATGVHCYINTVIQALMGCSAFNKLMLELEDQLQDNSLAKLYITILKNQLVRFNPNAGNNIPTYNPLHFMRAMAIEVEKMKVDDITYQYRFEAMSSGQQCSYDCLTLFLELLNNKRVDKLFLHGARNTTHCSACGFEEVNPISNKNMFFDIRPRDDGKPIFRPRLSNLEVSMQQLLSKHLKVHMSYPQDFKCDKCGVKNEPVDPEKKTSKDPHKQIVSVKESLTLLPEMVVIVFNYDADGQIADNYIPKQLSFLAKDYKSLVFRLVSQIEHLGPNINRGHYVSRSIRHGNRAFRFNDDQQPYPLQKLGTTQNTVVAIYNYDRKE